MWHKYRVEIVVDKLVGGIPANPKLIQAWLEANDAPTEARADQTAQNEAAVPTLDPELVHGVVFYRDMNDHAGPVYESRCFKAALKEGANIMKGPLGVKAYRSKLAERVFVGPPLVPITTPIKIEERPISVMTQMGPRTSIKRYEYAEHVPLTFELKVLEDGVVTKGQLQTILEYLQEGGIGADRSQGAGTFTLVKFDG